MKKIYSLILVLCMFASFGTVYAYEASSYDALRLIHTDTIASIYGSITMVTEALEGDSWRVIDNSEVTFESDNEYITVDSSGTVSASFPGTATITASLAKSETEILTAKVMVILTRSNPVYVRGNGETYKSGMNFANEGAGVDTTFAGLTGPYTQNTGLLTSDHAVYPQTGLIGVQEAWFYDNLSAAGGGVAFATDAQGQRNFWYINITANADGYYLKDTVNPAAGFNNYVMVAERSEGWHQVVVDNSASGELKCYIDSELIYEKTYTFPEGLNLAGKMVQIKTLHGGNLYIDKVREGNCTNNSDVVPVVKKAEITGSHEAGEELNLYYKIGIVPAQVDSGKSKLQWQRALEPDGEYENYGEETEIASGTSVNFNAEGDGEYYYRAKITPVSCKTISDLSMLTGNPYYSKAPHTPSAKVRLVGSLYEGGVLKGEYDFYDYNGDDEDKDNTVKKWYISDTLDGEYREIPGENGDQYTVKAEDDGKYIKFEVTPVSKEAPYFGKPVRSGTAVPSEAPVASDVKINGQYGVGNTLTGVYTYSDANNDPEDKENGTVYKWYRKNLVSGEKTEITEAADKTSYTITEADIDFSITFAVTPVSENPDNLPAQYYIGDTVESEPFLCAVLPKAKNAYIGNSSGKKITSASTGDIIYIYYDYTHEANIPEGETKIEIYNGTKLIDSGKTFRITKDMEGKKIWAEITPAAVENPKEGKKVSTDEISISKSTGGSVSVSSGSGSYSSSSSVNVPVQTVTAEQKALSRVKNSVVLKINSSKAMVNTAVKNVDADTAVVPFIENNRTLLPLRFIAESIGAKVEWDDAERKITVINGESTVIMHLDSDIMYINGVQIQMDVKARSVNGRTVIPVRYLSEALNKNVFWDDSGIVIVSDTENIINSQTEADIIKVLNDKLS